MIRVGAVALTLALLAGCAATEDSGPYVGADKRAAVSLRLDDPSRPAADRERDAARKPAELIAFAGVKPGDKVVDFLPGGGYFTRLLSQAVGPTGKVYAAAPPAGAEVTQPPLAFAGTAGYENVQTIPLGTAGLAAPEPVDVLWTAQNYHDMHLARLALDVAAVNRRFFESVKPGGVFLVIDHVGAAGTGHTQADSLHRIEPATARAEIEAAGFVFEGESAVLRSPADTHTANVFDPSIRGKTDQFVYKFRRPA